MSEEELIEYVIKRNNIVKEEAKENEMQSYSNFHNNEEVEKCEFYLKGSEESEIK